MRIVFLQVTTLLAISMLMAGCTFEERRKSGDRKRKPAKPPIMRLAGDVDTVPSVDMLARGRVLMSYSDCATCHKEADRKLGPAFEDVAARYPMNSNYIRVLAKRVILGTKGTWGNVVMPPHPTVSEADAETMVMYILSLEGMD